MMFRSLQRRIVLVFVGLLVLVMALILALVTRSNEKIVAAEMDRELAAGARVFSRLIEQNQRQLETAATVLSADYAFREAIATQDRPTIRSVIRNHGLRIGAQAMMIVSPQGQIIADTQQSAATTNPFPFPDLLAMAEASGKSTGFKQIQDGRLYQIVLVQILAPKRIAWVAMGFLVDDKWAADIGEMTGLAVSIIHPQQHNIVLLASSFTGAQRMELAQALSQLTAAPSQALSINGEPYQSLLRPLGMDTSVVLQRSITQARAPFKSLQTALWVIVLVGMFLFALGSITLAQRIVRPVNQLASAARRIEAGDYSQPVPRLPPDEIGQLATSFERMREQVASREHKILKLAYEDTLTGLANRTRLVEAFNHLPKPTHGAIIVLNLDRFALINNALGHPTGDRVLTEIGIRFGQLLSQTHLVARLWADEFAFLVIDIDPTDVMLFAESVLAKIHDPIALDGQRLDVGGSLGIALFPKDGSDANTLLRRAELAMRGAKRQRNNIAFVTDSAADSPHEQLSLIGEMRDAMAHHEFVVYYQPKLDLRRRQISGAEALIRWQHPVRGLVPPMSFIPFAEQTGFIREITPWLVETVAAHAAEWRKDGLAIVPSINLSTHDLTNPRLVEHVLHSIHANLLPTDGVCLEITESALMEDPELALKHLNELATLGLKLSIDDYGVGQASLAYLKSLPVHELKIDQTFIRAVADTPKNAAIVRSTIVLCHALGLSVVAEGAETAEDLDWLAHNDCDIAQGYGIARPMPIDQLADWIRAYHAEVAQSG